MDLEKALKSALIAKNCQTHFTYDDKVKLSALIFEAVFDPLSVVFSDRWYSIMSAFDSILSVHHQLSRYSS